MKLDKWDRRTWRFAAPVIVSNISVPLLGAVDMAVVGHLPGPEYLGAVAVAALIFSILYSTMNFLRMGTTGLTAQAFGANDGDEVRAWFGRAALIGVVIGLLIIVIQVPVALLALDVIAPSANVRPLAEAYYNIRIWGAPAALLNFALLGWFFGIQNTRAALISQIFMNGINIVLDIWFVVGLGWGVEGVAIATLISEVSAVGLGLYLVHGNARSLTGRWRLRNAFDTQRLLTMMRVNGDIFIRSICLQICFAVFTALGAREGDVILAANAVLMNVITFVAYGLDGFANAAEALAGEAYGARNRPDYRAAVRATSRWALILSAVMLAFVFAVGGLFIDLMTTVEDVRREARAYLPWVAIMPVVSVWCFQLDGIFIGTTHSADMRNSMAISLVLYLVMLPLVLPHMGNHGLWLAMNAFMAMRGITLAIAFPKIERAIIARD